MCRLILSGTPIQNNVLELWALFEFLMPSFLGPERDFKARYGKALQVWALRRRMFVPYFALYVLQLSSIHQCQASFLLMSEATW